MGKIKKKEASRQRFGRTERIKGSEENRLQSGGPFPKRLHKQTAPTKKSNHRRDTPQTKKIESTRGKASYYETLKKAARV